MYGQIDGQTDKIYRYHVYLGLAQARPKYFKLRFDGRYKMRSCF